MVVKIVTAKAHKAQLNDPLLKREIESISSQIEKIEKNFKSGCINFAFLRGMYVHSERRMTTVCLFINMTDTAIKELHGVIRLRFKDRKAAVATSTIDFDEHFLGTINNNEALLMHINIPVKGLLKDEAFKAGNFDISFDDVRVTPELPAESRQ